MKKANLVTAGLFSLLGLYVIIEAMQLPAGKKGVPGAGMFPIMIAVLMLTAAISLIISSLHVKPAEDEKLDLINPDTKRVYICMAILVLYVIVMPKIGFCVSSFLLLFGLIKWFGKYRYLSCVLISAIITAIVYSVFSMVLNVPMQFGLLI